MGEARQGILPLWDLYVDITVSQFAGVNLRSFAFAAARTVFEANVPAVPAADHLALLHDALAERESQVWAQVFNSVNAVIPAEQRDVQAIEFNGVAQAFRRQFREIGDTHPLIVHALMLYFRRFGNSQSD